MLGEFETELLRNIIIENGITGEDTLQVYCKMMEYGYFPELAYIMYNYEKKRDAQCLVLGASYGRDAIISDFYDISMASLANSSQDIYYDYLCFKRAEKEMNNLKFVIHSTMPFSLRYDESLSVKQVDKVRFYFWEFGLCHNNSIIKEEVKSFDKIIDSLGGLNGWNLIRREYWRRFFEESGWKTVFDNKRVFNRDLVGPVELEMIKAQYNKPFPDTILENKEIFDRYSKEVTSKGIKLCFFSAPHSSFYRERWDEDYQREMSDYMNYLSRKNDFTYLDLTKIELTDDYFRDSAHLNYKGAEFISAYIKEWMGV